MPQCLNTKIKGFTLIEVLIAMVIISIAFTAVLKASAQNIRETQYLQEKTLANWVGMSVISDAKLHVFTPPFEPETLDNKTRLLNQNWGWRASRKKTNNPKIIEIHVEVLHPTNGTPFLHLTGYDYVK